MYTPNKSIIDIRNRLLLFRNARDWKKFHKPKDLAISLILEASELLEHFQWKTDEEIKIVEGGTANG